MLPAARCTTAPTGDGSRRALNGRPWASNEPRREPNATTSAPGRSKFASSQALRFGPRTRAMRIAPERSGGACHPAAMVEAELRDRRREAYESPRPAVDALVPARARRILDL